jgi:hypothetical protein
MPPPTSSDPALRRVILVSRLNGWSVALFAGFAAGISLLLGDLTGVVVSLFGLVSGTIEIRGNRMLQRHDPAGTRSIIGAQLLLLTVVVIYAVGRIATFDTNEILTTLEPLMKEAIQGIDLAPEELRRLINMLVWAFYGSLILASCCYQGGLAFYYRRRQAAITRALASPPALEPCNPR